MKSEKNQNIDGIEIDNQYSKALNEIENSDNGAAEGYALWFDAHGYPDQANGIRQKITESETGINSDPKCLHGSTTINNTEENRDPYGYWEIKIEVCDHCGTELDQNRKYIIIKPKSKSKIAAESMKPEPETTEPEPDTPEDTTEPEPATITPQQAKYWYSVAKKDISEGNIEGAGNVLKWLESNNQTWYADLLEKAIKKAMPETTEPEPEPETTEPEPEPEPETTEPEPGTEGILKAKVNKKLIRAWVDPINTLVDEIKLNITKTGLTVKVVDPAHVAMLETTLDKKAFEDYKTKPFELGMDLDKLISFLKKGDQKKSAWVSVDYDQDHNKTIWNNGLNERTITNVDTAAMSDPKVPNLNLPNSFTIDRKTLFEAIKEGSEVSDHIRITSDPSGVTITAEGDTDNTKAFIPKGADQLPYLEAKEKETTLFSLDYLESITKAIKSDTVTIDMGTDYPLKMVYEHDGIKGLYLLAPRIEGNE